MIKPTTKAECEQHLRELDELEKKSNSEIERVRKLIAGQRRTVFVLENDIRLTQRARTRTTNLLKKLEKGNTDG